MHCVSRSRHHNVTVVGYVFLARERRDNSETTA